MDRLDVRLVALLQKDGTSTNAGIARQVGVSEETVRRRLKRLMQDDYIKVIAVPDARKIGYETQVLIGLQVDADKVDSVADALAEMHQVSWISVTTGSYDIFVWATLKSSDALSEFLRKGVGQIHGVRKMETFMSLGFRKQEYGLNMESVTV
jgi:Lrp/AsnC family transcriptional regulator for asnA, asnC and gidA